MTSSSIYKGIITAFSIFSLFLLNVQSAKAQWTKTSGPPGISVNVLYQSGNTLFAGTSSKGVFKSKDHGTTWSSANSGIENRTVLSLVADGHNLYAGTDQGVFRSTNNGTSWTAANTGIEGQRVISFLVSNGFVFAGTTGFGLFRSNNNGASWANASGGALDQSSIIAQCFSAPNLVVLADNLVFYSTDNGDSWFIPQNSPFVFSPTASFLVQGDSILLSATSGVFQSFSSGTSWGSFISVDLNAVISGLIKNGNTIYAGSPTGLFTSKNFGKTWKSLPATGLKLNNRLNHTFIKSGAKFLLGFDEAGVANSSDNGRSWSYSITGFTPASTVDNALTVSGNTLLSGTHSDGLYQSTNAGSTFTKLGSTSPTDSLSNGIVFSVLKINNIILAGTCGYGLFRSTDNGATFVRIRNGLPQQTGTAYLCIEALALSKGNVLAATDQGLFYSTDNGLHWNASNIPTGNSEVVGVAANDSVAVAAVENFTGPNKLYRSTNKGVTWTSVFSSSVDDWITVASDASSHFYVGTFGGAYVSNNNGQNFSLVGPGIPPGQGAFAIGVLGSNVFVGNGTGVYFSNNNGQSFTSASTGFDPAPNNAVQGFAFDGTNIYAGTFQDAVWKRPLSDFGITLAKTSEPAITDFRLNVYPNPFHDQTTVQYTIAQSGNVLITVNDLSGKIVYQSSEFSETGTHSKVLDVKLSNGIYILKIENDGHTLASKLMVQ